jgi:SecD/SecF fusion protein
MTTEERAITQLAEANPVSDSASPTAQQRAEAERILRRVLADAPAPHRSRLRLGLLAPVVSVAVVVLVAAVVLRTGGTAMTGARPSGGLHITLSALGTPQTPRITTAAMSREVALLRRRLASLGHGFTVSAAGANSIVVTGPKAATGGEENRILGLVTQRAQLRFYDWEADVLTPNGKSAASQLAAQTPAALSVSEGAANGAGSAGHGTGSMPLYDAVTLAARQPARLSGVGPRTGPQYFMFGAPGSSACAAAFSYWGASRPISGTHCLLAGPLELGPGDRQRATDALAAQVPPGVTASQGQVFGVPQGTVVVQAEQLQPGAPVPVFSPAARFFVLRDDAALTGADIANPRAAVDESGQPDVTFGFTATGRRAFQLVTQAIAHRGPNVSVGGATLNQHFAVTVDDQLITVPQINFHQYPDGISGGGGADITGAFTARSARDLATELRYGPLPLNVRVVP